MLLDSTNGGLGEQRRALPFECREEPQSSSVGSHSYSVLVCLRESKRRCTTPKSPKAAAVSAKRTEKRKEGIASHVCRASFIFRFSASSGGQRTKE